MTRMWKTRAGTVVTGASFAEVPGAGAPHAVADTPLSSLPTNGSTFAVLTSGNAEYADDPNVSGSAGENLGGTQVRGDSEARSPSWAPRR